MPNISENIPRVYPSAKVAQAAECYSEIKRWTEIYSGNPEWKKVNFTGLKGEKSRLMDMVNGAKMLCDRMSALTFAEQCDITVSREQEFFDGVLEKNGFWEKVPGWLSSAYAKGGGAFKVYSESGEIKIDYVAAEDFFPLEWNGTTITKAAFQTSVMLKGNYYTLIEIQEIGKITYRLFKSTVSDSLGKECSVSEAFPELAESTTLQNIAVPLFAYFAPNVNNNIFPHRVPLGISVYANAISSLHMLDIALDSYIREFVLGKKRIIVPAETVQPVTDIETGEIKRYFDTEDEIFVALNAEDAKNLTIADNSASLRVTEHIDTLDTAFNLLCAQVGLSPGTLSFRGAQGLKTATEVVSQESATARTIKSNKNILTETFEQLAAAIFALRSAINNASAGNIDVNIGWKDNVVIDDNTKIDNNIKLVSAGLKSKISAIMEIQNCDEETAQKELQRIAAESGASAQTVDIFG